MNTKYKEYLSELGVINEESFMNVINSIPFDADFTEMECYYDDNEDDIARNILNLLLKDVSPYAYCDEANFSDLYADISGVDTLEELDLIKEIFDKTNWKFNYDELKENIEEIEEETKNISKVASIRNKIYSLSNEQLIKLEKWIDEQC